MNVYVNGQDAVLRNDFSFEYVSENRLFTGSDGYSLAISFPLRGCRRNIGIFGHVHREDVEAGRVLFDCELRHGLFYKSGSLAVTEINETEVKCQFLEGRSEQNYGNPFDDIYLNEMDLGSWPGVAPANVNVLGAWQTSEQSKAVALPWVNDYSGNLQNCAFVWGATGEWRWATECTALSYQPYLLYILKRIFEAVGYECDLTEWEESPRLRWLLVCNTLPGAWDIPQYARALPHWTLTEFFEKLELFLGCEFAIDHRMRRASFAFTTDLVGEAGTVSIDRVVEAHSVEVNADAENARCEYLPSRNIVYKDCDHQMWNYYSCPWFIRAWRSRAAVFDTVGEMMATVNNCRRMAHYGRNSIIHDLMYCRQNDTYFVMHAVDKVFVSEGPSSWMPNTYDRIMEILPVNEFGGHIVDEDEDAEADEVEFVPVRIDYTEQKYGKCMFLSFSAYDDGDGDDGVHIGEQTPEEHKAEVDATLYQPIAAQTIEAGKRDRAAEYYDRIYIGWWDGTMPADGMLPHPHVHHVSVDDWQPVVRPVDLRLNSVYGNPGAQPSPDDEGPRLPTIDPLRKFTFSWLREQGADLHDPRAVYLIAGRRYVCAKLTVNITADGPSALVKGTFYRVIN